MEKADAKAVNDILDRLQLFGGILGPIVPEALTTLDGWNWEFARMPERLVLTRGAGPVPLIPAVHTSTTREKGWLVSLSVIFSDPDSVMIFVHDNWTLRLSPRQINLAGLTAPDTTNIWNSVYNPATPLGPMYGLMWTPAKFWPYRTQVTLQAQHPANALTPTSQVVIALLGRMYIRDSKQYYESIFVESQRQARGRVQVAIRRGS